MDISIYKLNIFKVPEEVVKYIKDNFEPLIYQADTQVFYDGHTPHVAIFLDEGDIQIIKRRKIQKKIIKNTLLACENVIDKNPIECEVRVSSGTRVYSIERSFLLKMIEDNHPLAHYLKEHLALAV